MNMDSHPQYAILARNSETTIKPSAGVIFLTLMVMAIEALAVFANGGYFTDAMTLCIVGLWICFLIYCISAGSELFAGWNLIQLTLLGLALAFWLWTGLSIIWSISPDESLVEFSRTGGYVAVFAIGILVGKQRFTRRLATILFLAITIAAAIYGLGPKTFPLLIDNLENAGRIAVPIGYTNAMGLLLAMGYLVSIYVSSDRAFHWALRLLSAMCAPLLLACLFFTLSRGAMLALIIGLIIYFAITPVRLRSFGVMLISLVPIILIARWSSTQDALIKNRIDMGDRLLAASSLRWYLLAAVVASGLIFIVILLLGRRVRISPLVKKLCGTTVLGAVLLILVTSSMWFISSKPSFSEWSRQAYHDIRYGIPSKTGTDRLLEMGSSGRWTLWEEALSSWEENPYLGSGGQSFPLIHLMKRDSDLLFVKQPHGHPFQLLAEFGLVGFLLGMAFISAAIAVCTLTLCRLKDRWERTLAAAILSMLIIYLTHASFDWDWNMFALTMIYFFFTGIMIGWPRPDAGVSRKPEALGEGAIVTSETIS